MMTTRTHKAIVKGTTVSIAAYDTNPSNEEIIKSNVVQHSEAADSFNECISSGEEAQLLAILDEMSKEQDAEIEAMKERNNKLKQFRMKPLTAKEKQAQSIIVDEVTNNADQSKKK